MARTTNYSLFESIFSVTPKVTETKFRNFERKIAARLQNFINLIGDENHSQIVDDVRDFVVKDGCNPSPRGRQPFRLTEFEKVKIGFYAQFLTLKTVADAFQVAVPTVAKCRDSYKFPKISAE